MDAPFVFNFLIFSIYEIMCMIKAGENQQQQQKFKIRRNSSRNSCVCVCVRIKFDLVRERTNGSLNMILRCESKINLFVKYG